MKRHKWQYDGAVGVTPGSGRPHGADESWTCTRCGVCKSRGPANTASGKRVIRWTYRDNDGYQIDDLPSCD